ncbi:hypothetical protein [Leifsonia poae]|uniref:Uncharacterized protein n=1 Tax=Leifsonia poae TaxID=110933 RepID=A0A9W6HDR8_9MICO|nr:hypothetical protein [Leifsonia poae]GLJ78266.1 hypothetical protein GCM10017584_38400 [Leifsonia poae]
MWTNVQFTGTLAAGASGSWYTWGWPPAWHVVWYLMPTTPKPGAPQVDWTIQVERGATDQCTYWIVARNLTTTPLTFEGRYAVLN